MLKNQKKFKLLIIDQDVAGMGGAENLLLNLTTEFKKSGIELWFVTNFAPLREQIKPHCSKTFLVPSRVNIFGGAKGLIKFIFQLPWVLIWHTQVLREYKSSGGKIVFITGFSDKIIVTPLAKLLGFSVIWLEHSPLSPVFRKNLGIPKYLYKFALKFRAKIITPSNFSKNRLAEELDIEKAEITVIPNGVHVLTEEQLQNISNKREWVRKKYLIPKKAFVLGVMSRLEKDKGQDTLIKSLSLIKNKIKNAYLLIAGEGDDRERLISIAKNLRVLSRVIFAGYVPENEKYILIGSFDLYVFATRWELEGFGIAALDAMNAGVVLIASNVGPIPEVVGKAGLLVEPHENIIADAVVKLYNQVDSRKKLSKKGRERINKFNIQDSARDYISFFRSI